ncbi:hypothetical protein Tco_0965169 [Tanacetum coccineum]
MYGSRLGCVNDGCVCVYMVGSASHMFMVPAGSSWFLLVVPAGRLCGSYWSAYGFFCLPCPILLVYAASIVRHWSSDALGS